MENRQHTGMVLGFGWRPGFGGASQEAKVQCVTKRPHSSPPISCHPHIETGQIVGSMEKCDLVSKINKQVIQLDVS